VNQFLLINSVQKNVGFALNIILEVVINVDHKMYEYKVVVTWIFADLGFQCHLIDDDDVVLGFDTARKRAVFHRFGSWCSYFLISWISRWCSEDSCCLAAKPSNCCCNCAVCAWLFKAWLCT